jgi:hypothetical protein
VQAAHEPFPSQTMLVPQAVPAERLPKSRQTGAPVWQLTMPVLQAVGLVEQFAFGVQVAQLPLPSQTMLAPQLVPPDLLLPSTQVCAPVAQEVTPVLHVFGLVVHGCPALHAAQVPLPSQTMPTPQLVPAAVLAPSVQVVAVPLHVVLPCLQAVGLPVQLWFATHAPQKPLPSHIWPPVHAVVADLGVPSTQVCAPVVQAVTPFRQIEGLLVHAAPAVHETQVPSPLHTWFVPQVVPAAVLPLSTHLGAPEAQSMTPVLHGAPGFMLQALPASHETHCPLPLHTMFEPQVVPALTSSPSMQPDDEDIPQDTTPSLQTPPGFVVQTVPAAQLVQAPALQTLSAPHASPSAAFTSSRHCGAPVEHATAPFLHGFAGLVVHDAPVAHGMQVPAALQTWPIPQLEPGLFAVPFMQPTGSQTMVPLRH